MKSLRLAVGAALIVATLFQGVPIAKADGILDSPFALSGHSSPSTTPTNYTSSETSAARGQSLDFNDPESGEKIFDITAFEADNSEEAEKAIEVLSPQIKQAINANPQGKFEVFVRMGEANSDANARQLDYEAFALGRRLASIDKRVSLSAKNLPVSPALRRQFAGKYTFDRTYRMTYSILRFFVAGSIAAISIKVTPHVSWTTALGIGAVAGSMSFALQYWSKWYYRNWLTKKEGFLANHYKNHPETADRFKAFVTNSELKPGELQNFFEKSDAWVRSYLIEVAYIAVLGGAMWAGGVFNRGVDSLTLFNALPRAIEHVLWPSLQSTLAQDSWDLSITYQSEQAEKHGTKTTNQINSRTQLLYLVNAFVAMGLIMANMIEWQPTKWIYFGVYAGGLATYYGVVRKKPENAPDSKRALIRDRIQAMSNYTMALTKRFYDASFKVLVGRERQIKAPVTRLQTTCQVILKRIN